MQTHEENAPTNTMQGRSLGAITLGPDDSTKGGYWFLNLLTVQWIHRRKFDPLPMPSEVMVRVNALGKDEGQPSILTFHDKHGNTIVDSIHSMDDVDLDEPSSPIDGDASITGVDDYGRIPTNDLPNVDLVPDQGNVDLVPDASDVVDQNDIPNQDLEPDMEIDVDHVSSRESDDEQVIPSRRSGRSRKPITRLGPIMSGQRHNEITLCQVHPDLHMNILNGGPMEYSITQLTMNRGLELFKEDGHDYVSKDLTQLHNCQTFILVCKKDIPCYQNI